MRSTREMKKKGLGREEDQVRAFEKGCQEPTKTSRLRNTPEKKEKERMEEKG